MTLWRSSPGIGRRQEWVRKQRRRNPRDSEASRGAVVESEGEEGVSEEAVVDKDRGARGQRLEHTASRHGDSCQGLEEK